MAQAQPRSSSKRSPRSTKGSASGRNTKGSSRSKSGSTRARSGQSRSQRNGKGTAQKVQQTVKRTARDAEHSVADATSNAGRAVGDVATKLKTPAIATGAAAAGVAGGLLIARQRSRPKLLGVLPRGNGTVKTFGEGVLKATENVGRAGERVGRFSEEIRRVREGMDESINKRRSPIGVVLDGLTHRPS
jgi:hypothetical protein